MLSLKIASRNFLFLTMLSAIALSRVHAQDVLSGRVYVGDVGDESTPKSGVTVRLFGSSNPGIRDVLIGSTTTNGTGGYSIGAPSGYEYYHIVETVPSGYQAEGASSVDGTVMNSNYIQYSIVSEPLSAQTLTDNKFWIKPEALPNNAPHAKDDFVSTPKNTAATINVLNNDSDPDGDTITLQTKSSASHGTVTKSGNQIIYAPGTGYTGPDQFEYSISDGRGGLDSAAVYITVTEPGATLAAIGDRVWLDVNRNGLQDTGEPGVANVWIDISDSTGTPWMGTSTDALGLFKIYNLPPGKYTLIFSLPAGYVFTQPFQGNDPSIDSNADSNSGSTVPVMLSGGEYNQTIDAGLIQQENIDFDFGDAPDPAYPTLLASNGARHKIVPGIYLGYFGVDAEPDGQPNSNATGDDSDGNDDENGVGYGYLVTGEICPLFISVSAAGYLNAWYDFNADGDWTDSDEQIFKDLYLTAGNHTVQVSIPILAMNDGAGRFRFSTQAGLSFTGEAADGEVEDCSFPFLQADYGDAPAPYPTLHLDNGARHGIQGPFLGASVDADLDGQPENNAMGDDLDGQDDEDGIIFLSTLTPGQTATISVYANQVHHYGLLNAWIDFNSDKDWNDPGEQVFADVQLSQGTHQMSFPVPGNAIAGKTFARFRFAETFKKGIAHEGFVEFGEVEDYAVDIGASGTGSLTVIKEATPKDDTPFWITTSWGFMGGAAPYRDPSANSSTMTGGPAGTYYLGEAVPAGWTLKDIVISGDDDNGSLVNVGNRTADVDLDDGEQITVVFKNEKTGEAGFDHGDAPFGYADASHPLGGPWLGGPGDKPDAEVSMQNDPHARGDDQDGNDDEDCVMLANFIQGQGGELHLIMNSGPTGSYTDRLWIDFNQDGDWDDPGELLGGAATNGPKNSMSHANYYMSSLHQLKTGKLIARMRIYEGIVIAPSVSGPGTAGEVEDFEIEVKAGGMPIPQGAVIYGAKWNDLDGNSQWDANEPPLPGWTIWLDHNQNGIEDAGDTYDKTDASGQFEFSGLGAGTYVVGEKMKAGWLQTWPGGPATQTLTVDPQKPNAGILFGNQLTDAGQGKGALKWNQPPLFDPMGTDTTAYYGWAEPSVYSDSFLADDWFCYNPRPVTRVRWWGSYAEWSELTPPDDAPPYFHLGIWSDNPKGEGNEFSHPGELIQEWFVERARLRESADKLHRFTEFMDKSLTCYQYTFDIPPDEQFDQEGEKNIYWLHVAAAYSETQPDHTWGWLTRERYFKSEAVRIHQPEEPHPGTVFEAGETILPFWDLAFVLGTDEYISEFDFADAPDQYYGSTLSRNGPLHLINSEIHLGEQIDADFDGQAHSEAQGDDDDGLDDEDGVQMIYPLVIGGKPEFLVKASVSGFLNAWIDREQDGNFFDADDHIIRNAELGPGDNVIAASGAFNGIEPGQRMARFRFSTEPDLWFKGFAMDGEVEDLMVMIYAADDVSADQEHIPSVFRLSQNYPNPFNPSTAIPYDVPWRSHVKITLYNLAGQRIVQLVNADHEPGQYKIIWHGMDAAGNAVSSGIYVILMEAGSFRKTGKLVLIR